MKAHGAFLLLLLGHWPFFAPEPVRPQSSRVRRVEDFRHSEHVRRTWGTGEEFARDCRGCHQYRTGSETQDPQGVCDRCHRDGSLRLDPTQTTPGFLENLDALREADRPFGHFDHRRFDCQRCHDPIKGTPDDAVPGGRTREMKMKAGWHTCMECHDPVSTKAPESDKTVGAAAAAFVDRLNGLLGRRPNRRNLAFRHDEHLVSMADGRGATCTPCHGELMPAGLVPIGPVEVDAAACGRCHTQGPPRSPIAVTSTQRPEAGRLFGTFAHGPHLDEDALTKDAGIRSRGCLACHEVTNDGQNYILNPDFRERGYGACTTCHAHQQPEWQLLDAAGKVDHGQIESCQPCHEFGAGDMKTLRPTSEVDRPRPARFALVSQDHPFISVRGGRVEESADCRKCHRALPEGDLPTRIGTKPFSHDSHLPPTPTATDCVPCHGTVTSSQGPSDLPLFDPSGCGSCHQGGEVRAVFDASPGAQSRSVPRFPHAVHLSTAALEKDPVLREQQCLACHVPEQNGAPGVGVTPEAATCTPCHDHGERPELCGGKGRAYVASCAQCHGPDGPRPGVPPTDFRFVTTGLQGAQWHPLPTEQACASCHLPGDPVVRISDKVNVFADLRYGKSGQAGFHATFDTTRAFSAPGRCGACHHHELMGNRAPAGFTDSDLSTAKGQREDLTDYPGGNR